MILEVWPMPEGITCQYIVMLGNAEGVLIHEDVLHDWLRDAEQRETVMAELKAGRRVACDVVPRTEDVEVLT